MMMEAAVKDELEQFLSKNISAESLRYDDCSCQLFGTVLSKISLWPQVLHCNLLSSVL